MKAKKFPGKVIIYKSQSAVLTTEWAISITIITFVPAQVLIKKMKVYKTKLCVCFIRIRTKHSSNTLLKLVRIFIKQTLFVCSFIVYNKFYSKKCKKFMEGSIHIWRQMFFGHFWPTYLPKNLTSYMNSP